MRTLKLIGYWRSDAADGLPDPADLVDRDWDDFERHMVSLYFRRGTIARTSAYSHCRICGKNNGSYEFSDGTYLWPEGLAHYLDDHAVRLPAEIVHHAMLRLDEVLHAEIDRTWW